MTKMTMNFGQYAPAPLDQTAHDGQAQIHNLRKPENRLPAGGSALSILRQ